MTEISNQIRAFIAIELPEKVKTGIQQLEGILKSQDPAQAKWVNPSSIHLTLKFLGTVGAEKLDGIIRVMKKSAQATGPFHLEIQGLGAFPNLRKAQVIWIGIKGDMDNLHSLQKSLEGGLAEEGFPPEGRPFTPHLTLARLGEKASSAERQALGEIIYHLKLESALALEVRSFNLMRSQLTRGGAIYTQLASIDL
jgi:2'-5' RNA ligase